MSIFKIIFSTIWVLANLLFLFMLLFFIKRQKSNTASKIGFRYMAVLTIGNIISLIGGML